eukprot:SM000127S26601  [mRNA]  locus=s127:51982:53777:+ [translate_table: standard]
MDDWDAEDFEPPPPVIGKEPLKGQWDDEDAEEEEPVAAPPAPARDDDSSAAEASKAKADKAGAEKKKKKKEDDGAPGLDQALADPVAEKLRQQRLVEESDYKATRELFGSQKEARALDDFIPKTEEDFMEYAELIASKITPFQKSYHYSALLKRLLRTLTMSMDAAETKDLTAALTVIQNEKLKAEKDAAGKKKAGAKKKQLHVEKAADDDYRPGAYDAAGDDFDFM